MRLARVTLFLLEIPFVEAFSHSAHRRTASDAIVVRIESKNGTPGYGEGLARPYVTGESPGLALGHLAEVLWPAVAREDFAPLERPEDLARVDAVLPEGAPAGVLAAHASRAAMEVAVIDCLLRERGLGLGALLPPKREEVRYAGVVSATSPEKAATRARQMKEMGLEHLKVKVAAGEDEERVRRVAEALGPGVPFRLDANGGYGVEEAIAFAERLAGLPIEAIEEPVRRTTVEDLARFKRSSAIPVVADEYLVTREDAAALVRERACDLFNVRVSKCGGLWRSWTLARQALAAGLGVQVGAQVGETAILSAAGRHLAAALEEVRFVEGSYGTFLLAEDVSRESVAFEFGGAAPILRGPGLGIEVDDAVLRKYAREVVELESP